jgi:transposase-like protein
MSHRCNRCDADCPDQTKYGFFVRRSDQKKIQRFKCRSCGFVFSAATFQECYRQKKRKINPRVYELLCSGVSQRRCAKILKVTRRTVVRKFLFLAAKARFENLKILMHARAVTEVQFDDLETFEHTKMKPLSVTLAVEKSTRRILGFKVAQMPAKGLLARKARKKYGPRPDHRAEARRRLFEKLQYVVHKNALFESDNNPHYPPDVKKYFPEAIHQTVPGARGAVVGQGELKKLTFDPLFTLNHTFAMLRANINRLFRKTWCTTKLPGRLDDHIELYVHYHNNVILKGLV